MQDRRVNVDSRGPRKRCDPGALTPVESLTPIKRLRECPVGDRSSMQTGHTSEKLGP